MRIIEPNVDLIQQEPTFDGMLRHIERCGRTCYKSENKISEDSAKGFVKHMIDSNHTAMLEHGTVYLTLPMDIKKGSEPMKRAWYHNNELVKYREIFGYIQSIFMFNPYSIVNLHTDHDTNESSMCITTNYRVIIENGWEDIMNEFKSEPTQWHTPRFTLVFTTNIGVTREGNRMRANSIAEESTRYCNYNKAKFGEEITFTAPVWLSREQIDTFNAFEIAKGTQELLNCGNYTDEEYPELVYLSAIANAEIHYMTLIKCGWKPQQAREVLPLATKSDVVYTAFPHQWRHFFDLRLFGKTGIPHPNMQYIASLARDILCEKDLWYLIYRPDEPEFSAHQVEGDATIKQD